MTQRDHWTEKLTCPNSMASNVVELSQSNHNSDAYHAGDQKVRLETEPVGFRVLESEKGYEFYCASWGALAIHSVWIRDRWGERYGAMRLLKLR
jgi:hypothetical protein